MWQKFWILIVSWGFQSNVEIAGTNFLEESIIIIIKQILSKKETEENILIELLKQSFSA